MRKTVGAAAVQVKSPQTIDVDAHAHVAVTSEDATHPIEHAFDGRGAPGGTEWVAGGPGDQTITVSFDSPQAVRAVVVEVEETRESRLQEIELAVASGSEALVVVLRQEFHFSAPGTTLEREHWSIDRKDVRQIRLVIRPEKSGGSARARLTTLAFER
ncbi:MAG TPA: hypothetical protein VGM06_01175 [Polyangiaceae bacterium]|jgi:hypothetical protein